MTMIVAEYFGCILSGGERGYISATEGCKIGAGSCQILVGGAVWSSCDLELEAEARQKE